MKYPDVEIYLDMDGVISDFDTHADQTGVRNPDGSLKYDDISDESWYETMPVFDHARGLYDDLCEIGKVRFLTAPIMHPGCFSGKAKWIAKFIPENKFILADLMIITSRSKRLVAKPHRILIDDTQRNIDEWIAAGGIGIHHDGDAKKTMEKVKSAVTKYKATAKPKASKPKL